MHDHSEYFSSRWFMLYPPNVSSPTTKDNRSLQNVTACEVLTTHKLLELWSLQRFFARVVPTDGSLVAMSNNTDIEPSFAAPATLSPEAFAYMDSLAPATVTNLIGNLVDAGDLPNLKNALDAGCAAVTPSLRLDRILRMVRQGATSGTAGNPAYRERFDFAVAWIAACHAEQGVATIETLARKSIREATVAFELDLVLGALSAGCPELDFHAIDEYRQFPDPSTRIPGDSFDEHSLIGDLVVQGFVDLALDLVGRNLTSFPVTRRMRTFLRGEETLNLAEQIMLSSQLGQEQLERLVDAISPDAKEPWHQLGDMVLRTLQRHNTATPSDCDKVTDCGYYLKGYKDDKRVDDEEVVMPVYAILGAGAQFRDPDKAWARIRAARVLNNRGYADDADPDMPLAHALLHAGDAVYSQTLSATALRRMVEEGGLATDIRANLGNGIVGINLIQFAALCDHRAGAEVLLSVGADPMAPGAVLKNGSAIEIARSYKNTEIERMILAHQAHKAIGSVLSPLRAYAPDR